MPRHTVPAEGYEDPTQEAIEQFLSGDDALERQILELDDKRSELKRLRHDHRNKIISELKQYTPPMEAAKKFADTHTPMQCRLDLISRFLTYRARGVFNQAELFEDPIISALESCMQPSAA